MPHLNDRSDELDQEAWQQHERRVEGMEVVHDEALDMGTIMVLICHNHQVAISQLLHISVHLAYTQANETCLLQHLFAILQHCWGRSQLQWPVTELNRSHKD